MSMLPKISISVKILEKSQFWLKFWKISILCQNCQKSRFRPIFFRKIAILVKIGSEVWLSHLDDLWSMQEAIRMTALRNSSWSHPDELAPGRISSEWLKDTAGCHPDKLGYCPISSGWHNIIWTLSHPDELAPGRISSGWLKDAAVSGWLTMSSGWDS